jgi:hypothetical protein
MQIKEVTHLEVEISGSADLTQNEMTSLLLGSFPKGFRDVLVYEITQKSAFCNTHGNYVVGIQPPEKPQHIEGTFYNKESLDAKVRDILATFQQKVDAYQQHRTFCYIQQHRVMNP